MIATFIRALYESEKGSLLQAAAAADCTRNERREVSVQVFEKVDGSPFAYWVSNSLRDVFASRPPFESDGRGARVGLQTSDDFRFVRRWSEIKPLAENVRWINFVKGGKFARFYKDIDAVLNWERDGRELKAWAGSLYSESHWSRILKNVEFMGRPGLSWPLRGSEFSAQAVPMGSAFSVAGKMAFVPGDCPTAWLALFNSSVFDQFIAFFAGKVGGVQYEAGLIRKIPVPEFPDNAEHALVRHAQVAWRLRREVDSHTETSHAFTCPAALHVVGASLDARAAAWLASVAKAESDLVRIQALIDDICFELYGIGVEDRQCITEGFGSSAPVDDGAEPEEVDDNESDDESEDQSAGDLPSLTAELVAWAVGVAVGRFDVRLATGERQPPPEPDPFDPLPVCSPGMLTGEDGLPVASPPPGYPVAWPTDGVLVNDEGHLRDLVAAVRSVFDVVFGKDSDASWQEAASILDPKGHDLRAWLSKSFFEHHIRKHSKSRRKAPILWQLGLPSGKYSVWLYAHRVTGDRLFSVLNDIVRPKVRHEEDALARLKAESGASPTRSQRHDIEEQEDFVAELKTMADEVARVAPLWAPDLDDGVVICLAPLWRLFPQHKPWQKECKQIWDKLVDGDYDWAHLAMHLWPERVVPKCVTDRSLAIAHDLEDVFWQQNEDEKWVKRKPPEENGKSGWQPTIDRLVAERTSRQVKDALASLLAAPVAEGGKRGRRAAATAAKSPTVADGGAKKKGKASKARDESEELF